MLDVLSRTKTLWATFLLTIVLTIIFGIVMHVGQFGIIDEMFVAEDIRAHIDAMTPRQRTIHAWLTGTVDVIYPFAYGAFFIGVALKYFGRFGIWLALPSFLVIPCDLTEGFAQVMLLTGHDAYMDLKLIATPAKLILYIMGLLITAAGLLLGGKRRLKASSKT